jgi:hypothetical protein
MQAAVIPIIIHFRLKQEALSVHLLTIIAEQLKLDDSVGPDFSFFPAPALCAAEFVPGNGESPSAISVNCDQFLLQPETFTKCPSNSVFAAFRRIEPLRCKVTRSQNLASKFFSNLSENVAGMAIGRLRNQKGSKLSPLRTPTRRYDFGSRRQVFHRLGAFIINAGAIPLSLRAFQVIVPHFVCIVGTVANWSKAAAGGRWRVPPSSLPCRAPPLCWANTWRLQSGQRVLGRPG